MIQVTLWGTRGSVPVSGEGFVAHGGATTCVEVVAHEERVIIDCGTGLTKLGKARCGAFGKKVHIYQTHMHWDHVQGFPFFAPLFDTDVAIHLHAAKRQGQTICDVLRGQMSQPTFPVGLDVSPAALHFHDLDEASGATHGELRMTWREMAHPGGSTAYRFTHQGACVVFSGDVEVQQGSFQDLVELSCEADVLIMDAQYFPSEYSEKRGYGHSTPLDAVEVAVQARVKRLILTHHDPSHDDERLEEKLALARAYADGHDLIVDNARDGLVVDVSKASSVPARLSA